MINHLLQKAIQIYLYIGQEERMDSVGTEQSTCCGGYESSTLHLPVSGPDIDFNHYDNELEREISLRAAYLMWDWFRYYNKYPGFEGDKFEMLDNKVKFIVSFILFMYIFKMR